MNDRNIPIGLTIVMVFAFLVACVYILAAAWSVDEARAASAEVASTQATRYVSQFVAIDPGKCETFQHGLPPRPMIVQVWYYTGDYATVPPEPVVRQWPGFYSVDRYHVTVCNDTLSEVARVQVVADR